MKKNKGVISMFVLLAMMFFLIFITVAYNNVAQKGKTQVETEEILLEYYRSVQGADGFTNGIYEGLVNDSSKENLLRGLAQQQKISASGSTGSYIYSNGKIYIIQ